MQGVLLLNTGSPATKKVNDVASFISAMLSDPMLINVADWFRPILVNNFIVPFRKYKSTKKYSLIWDEQHDISPLMFHMQQLASKLEKHIGMPVEIAMRYGQPDIETALYNLKSRDVNIHEVSVVPLFPQYAESSYQTVVDEVGRVFMKQPYPFRLQFVKPYFRQSGYIEALCSSLKPYLNKEYDALIFNFHSLPLSHVEKGWKKGKEFDYIYQLKETVLLIQKTLDLNINKSRIAYSSAIGHKWLQPSLDGTMQDIAKEGKKDILVISPGFACDNLETLYDIKIRAKEQFFKYGGRSLTYVPCLNSEDYWVEELTKIIFP